MITSPGHQHVPIRWRHLPRGTCQEGSNTSDGHNFGIYGPIRTKLGRVMFTNMPDVNAPHLSQCATFVAKRHFRHHAPFWPQLRLTKPDTALNLNLRIRSAPKSAAPGYPKVEISMQNHYSLELWFSLKINLSSLSRGSFNKSAANWDILIGAKTGKGTKVTLSAFCLGPGIYPLASSVLNIINPLWGNLPLNFP